MTMAREVEKLQAQLMNSANSDRRAGILNYLVYVLFSFILLSVLKVVSINQM